MMAMQMSTCLLIIDVQNDFCSNGALEVPNGEQVVEPINRLAERFENCILTQDWHPAEHISFASSHPNHDMLDTIQLPYGPQVLWPDHCVQGTHGARFHPELETDRAELIVRKGFRHDIDSYSAFFENDKKTPTGLGSYLRERGFDRLYLVGLATDFCVADSAIDAVGLHFSVYVIDDACRAIDTNGSLKRAWDSMEAKGVRRITSESVDI